MHTFICYVHGYATPGWWSLAIVMGIRSGHWAIPKISRPSSHLRTHEYTGIKWELALSFLSGPKNASRYVAWRRYQRCRA